MICLKTFLVLLALARISSCFFHVEFTDGRPIFWGDNKTINFDNMRVRRVNRSDHLVTGSFETFVEIGDDFEVRRFMMFSM